MRVRMERGHVCACAEALQTYIYIYTHSERLVCNHEPRAKALGNEVCVCVPELNDIAPLLSICHLLISGVRRKTHVKCEPRVKDHMRYHMTYHNT